MSHFKSRVVSLLHDSDAGSFVSVAYTTAQSTGVAALIVVSLFSFFAVLVLLSGFVIWSFLTRKSMDDQIFVRTQVSVYFVCLMLCDGLQAIGSIMNTRWFIEHGVRFGPLCSFQGLTKQAADLGIAMWNVVIALHSFNHLVLEGKVSPVAHWSILVFGWAALGVVVLYGPIAAKVRHGKPFYNVTGLWCGISPDYPTERIALEYVLMALAAVICFVLCVLAFLRLQGYLVVNGWSVTFNLDGRGTPDFHMKNIANTEQNDVAKRMMFHPIAYILLVIPVASVRFLEWTGRKTIRFEGVIFCSAIFLLSGAINAILFVVTSRIFPSAAMSIWPLIWPVHRRGPEEGQRETSDESLSSSDPNAPSAEATEEDETDEKARGPPVFKRGLSFDSNGDSEILDGSEQPRASGERPMPEDVPSDVRAWRRNSMDSMFSEEVSSLQEVQLSARQVDSPVLEQDPWQ